MSVFSSSGHRIVEDSGTVSPTTGYCEKGQFVKNSSLEELGTAGSKYIIWGFVCTASGAPGTWVEMRFLTGN